MPIVINRSRQAKTNSTVPKFGFCNILVSINAHSYQTICNHQDFRMQNGTCLVICSDIVIKKPRTFTFLTTLGIKVAKSINYRYIRISISNNFQQTKQMLLVQERMIGTK